MPVRIAVERKPDDPPLRAGMSVTSTIDTGHRRDSAHDTAAEILRDAVAPAPAMTGSQRTRAC